MNEGTRIGLLALAAAALLGLLGDLLLRATPWGLNAPLWLLALVVGAGLLVHQARLPLLGQGRWLALVALVFAGGIALRDSTALVAVNLLAVLLTLGLAGHRAHAGWPHIGGLLHYAGALLSAGFHACGGALVLAFYDVRWQQIPRTGWSAGVLAALRGLLIGIPLVMVFGALFMAADAVFSGLVSNLLAVDVRELVMHLFWIGAWAWLTAGFLRQLLFCTVARDGIGMTLGADPIAAVGLTPDPSPLPGSGVATPLVAEGSSHFLSESTGLRRYAPMGSVGAHGPGSGAGVTRPGSGAPQSPGTVETASATADSPRSDEKAHAEIAHPAPASSDRQDTEAVLPLFDHRARDSSATPPPRVTRESEPRAEGISHGRESEPGSEATLRPAPRRAGGRIGVLGIVELSIVLGLLDMLFLAFVLVQFRYLFGGAELVQVSSTLTFAEYARRGFFELVAVAALLLPIMLILDWAARLDRARDTVIYRALSGLLVALLFVVIVSALQRMRLYTHEFGLTELRLYTTAFMLWITSGVIWYLATVLRDHRERFAFGALVAGLVVAGALNAIDPDDLIVRSNAARPDAPARFDGMYSLLLSADAGPALIEALPSMPEYQRVTVARRLIQRWEQADADDWRSWNYGRWRSLQATAANETLLRQAAQEVPPSTPSESVHGSASGGSRLEAPGPGDRP